MTKTASRDVPGRAYQVGGCVRDALLGLPLHDRDWVVVGARPEQMVAAGFRQVGAEFPVFLHPETAEEFALARTERKTGPGYLGFDARFGPEVTLETDLARRDLTINAMARDASGRLVDPFGGRADLAARVLRHVSPAFAEDPLRVLRVARFAARFHGLGFTIAPETEALLGDLAASGELAALTPERVWGETQRALASDHPRVYFEVLEHCGGLAEIFPELAALIGKRQPPAHHPEGCAWTHTLLALDQAVRLGADVEVRLAVLLHDLGKGTTPEAELPRHIGHEQRGEALAEAFGARLRLPKESLRLATLTARQHLRAHRALEMTPAKIVRLFKESDALRNPERFGRFLLACEADARGRGGAEQRPYPQAAFLRAALEACRAVKSEPFRRAGLRGEALGQAIHRERLRLVERMRADAANDAVDSDATGPTLDDTGQC